jgi:AcrR family transcriptional regulator
MLQVREDAIVASVNRLLAEKGFEAMTVDEVAADVGIAKASLYKHFPSKELLAAAAMVRVLQRALAFLDSDVMRRQPRAIERLRAITRWAIEAQLAGQMPLLPSQNSTLRAALLQHRGYLDAVDEVSERLREAIVQARLEGDIDPALPPEVVLYTLFARACDPVVALLQGTGQYDDERIVQTVLRTCFDGLRTR